MSYDVERSAGYAEAVERMTDAIHETCVEEWRRIGRRDPGRLVTQHMRDAHEDEARDLVRRYGLPADLESSAVIMKAASPGTCELAPPGWYCSLEKGHDGPCPTWQMRR